MMASTLIQIPLAVLMGLAPPQVTFDCRFEALISQSIEERALADFNANVDAYIGLRHRLVRWIDPTATFGEVFEDELRAMVGAARPRARQGDFFTSSIAYVFRQRIDRALLHGVAGMPAHLYEPLAGEWTPEVNKPFPMAVGVVVDWPALLLRLPELPSELGYVLWGRDLVLVDVPANLVLDVLPEVLPEGAYPGVVYQ